MTNAMDIFRERSVDNGKIKISQNMDAASGKALLKISDNGGGINKEIIERVFDPYFTTRYRTKEKGLSLYGKKHNRKRVERDTFPEKQ